MTNTTTITTAMTFTIGDLLEVTTACYLTIESCTACATSFPELAPVDAGDAYHAFCLPTCPSCTAILGGPLLDGATDEEILLLDLHGVFDSSSPAFGMEQVSPSNLPVLYESPSNSQWVYYPEGADVDGDFKLDDTCSTCNEEFYMHNGVGYCSCDGVDDSGIPSFSTGKLCIECEDDIYVNGTQAYCMCDHEEDMTDLDNEKWNNYYGNASQCGVSVSY